MTDTNEVVLIGRQTKDLGDKDFGYVGQNAKLTLNLAVNRSVKKGEEWVDDVSYFEAVVWGKTAENIKQYVSKGKQICITGYLKQDRWEKDNQKHSKVVVIANQVQLLGGKDKNETSTFTKKEVPENVQQLADAVGGEVFPEDIPF